MKNWWTNNSWRFWAFQWVKATDPYKAMEIWQEYRYMLNPNDKRSLAELIIEEYETDVDRAVFKNPFLQFIWWIRQL